jgi:hypothetical protein
MGRRFSGIGGARRDIRAVSGVRNYLLNYSTGGTFTRASEAALYDFRNGTFGSTPWPGTNVRRVLSDGSVLIEGARTNLCTTSQAIGSGNWNGEATQSADTQTAPDATATADTQTNQAGTFGSRRYNNLGPSAIGATVSASGFVKNGTAGVASVQMQDGAAIATNIVTTDVWQRLTRSALSNGYFEWFNTTDGQTNGTGHVVGATNHWWGMQAEIAAYPTTPIRTSGATATRAVDVLTFASGSWNLYTGVWAIDLWPQYSSAEGTDNPVILSGLSVNDYLQLVGGGSPAVWMVTNSAPTTRTATWSRFQRLTIKLDWNARLVTLSGFTTGNGSFAMPASTWTAAQSLAVGRLGGANHFNGIIGRPYTL